MSGKNLEGALGLGSVVEAVRSQESSSRPFDHLVMERVFSETAYGELLDHLPERSLYEPFRSHADAVLPDGTVTRFRFPLVSEKISTLGEESRALWGEVVDVLCSENLREALFLKFERALERRFGVPALAVPVVPQAFLFKDLAGYRIRPHQDTARKAVTFQVYLPRDDDHPELGTVFHRKERAGFERAAQMAYRPNRAYAFPVTPDSWHSVDEVRAGAYERDSLMVLYYIENWDGKEFSSGAAY